MSLETNAASIIGSAMVDSAGGSVILFGLIALVGIAILMKKLEMGLSSGIVIAVFLLGYLADTADQHYLFNTPIGGSFGLFKLLYLLLVIGAALYWAIFLRRR